MLFAHYLLASSATENIRIDVDGTVNNVAVATSLSGSNNPGFSCAGQSNVIKTMVDKSYTHSISTLTLKLDLSSTTLLWGIKEFILLIKLCDPSCSACNGYYAQNCTTCTESTRIATYTGYTGICKCYGSAPNATLMYE